MSTGQNTVGVNLTRLSSMSTDGLTPVTRREPGKPGPLAEILAFPFGFGLLCKLFYFTINVTCKKWALARVNLRGRHLGYIYRLAFTYEFRFFSTDLI